MNEPRVKVLYIGGYGRSGSTLLNRLLGALPGFHAVGETWYMWERSVFDNELCGCGKPIRECEFWRAVVDAAFGGFDNIDLDKIKACRQALESQEYLPAVIYPQLRTAVQQAVIGEYQLVMKKLYLAIHAVSGSRVIVDSSKGPRYAMLLNEIPELDLRLLHLVRDSRAVAYSWQKKRIRPEVYWKTAYMYRPGLIHAALAWGITNVVAQSFRRKGTPYLFARYEDIVASPRAWLTKIVHFAGEEEQGDALFVRENVVHLSVDHTAAGNPNRFRQGTVEVRRDDEWQQKMPRGERLLVTALTLPLLYKYGYLNGHAKTTYPQLDSSQTPHMDSTHG